MNAKSIKENLQGKNENIVMILSLTFYAIITITQ
jgi:hypothetical protein